MSTSLASLGNARIGSGAEVKALHGDVRLPLKADIGQGMAHVCFVPLAEVARPFSSLRPQPLQQRDVSSVPLSNVVDRSSTQPAADHHDISYAFAGSR